MNGIEKITGRIAAEAQTEADAVLSQGKERADALRSEYEKKVRDTYDELIRTGKERVEQDVLRQGRTARLEAKKDTLSVKQEMITAAYDRALELLQALPEEQYAAFLARQAGAAALTGREEIIMNARDRAKVGRAVTAQANAIAAKRGLPGELTLSPEVRPISGGVVLHQGDIEVNCTLDSLLELSRGDLDAKVAGILFR